jgi:hypothetical protein
MPLRLRYKTPPDIQVLDCPSIWPAQEDIVGHDIVVAKRGHDWDNKITAARSMLVILLSKHLDELGHHVFILLNDLFLGTGQVLVVVVARRVACPYHEVDVVFDIVVDPLESLVDEGEGRVAAGRLCAVDASWAMITMARGF